MPSNIYNQNYKNTDTPADFTFHYGLVIQSTDPTEAGRIKVRVEHLDGDIPKGEETWSYPLLPRFYNVVPKVGEGVIVFAQSTKSGTKNRMYIGPMLAQDVNLEYQAKRIALGSTSSVGIDKPGVNPRIIPSAKYVYPSPQDVSIQGRENADIILSKATIDLRAGKHKTSSNIEFNKKGPAWIQLKYNGRNQSYTNIMGHRINLITYKGTPSISVDQLLNKGLSAEDGAKELQTYLTATGHAVNKNDIDANSRLHPYVFGDELIKFLDLLLQYVENHSHPWNGHPADNDTSLGGTGIKAKKDELLKYKNGGLLKMLSKTIYGN